MYDVHKHTVKTMCNNEQNEETFFIANTCVHLLDMNKSYQAIPILDFYQNRMRSLKMEHIQPFSYALKITVIASITVSVRIWMSYSISRF